MEKSLKMLEEATQSPTLWFSFDDAMLITDEELRAKIKAGSVRHEDVSSRPDVFPVFGNMKSAVDALLYKPKETYECHPNATGFKNPTASSCFLDSVLVAMFHLKRSPFYTGLFKKRSFSNDGVCSSDPEENDKLKKQVQALMKKDIDTVMSEGRSSACIDLRKILGKICRSSHLDEDMSKGIHDAVELYIRIMKVLEYDPIKYHVLRSRSDSESGPFIPDEEQPEYRVPKLEISLKDDDKNVSWPHTWIKITQNPDPPTPYDTFIRTEIVIESADVIVVSIDRALMADTSHPASKKEISSKMSKQRVPVDTLLDVNSRSYQLMSVVYLPHPGHYQTLLKCNGIWRIYNDLRASSTYMKNEISNEEATLIIETKSTLLFYY